MIAPAIQLRASVKKGEKVKENELKLKLISSGLFVAAITLMGAMAMMWLAVALWEYNPAAPGIVAFVFGGTFIVYRAMMAVYRAYIDVLADEDMGEEDVVRQ